MEDNYSLHKEEMESLRKKCERLEKLKGENVTLELEKEVGWFYKNVCFSSG